MTRSATITRQTSETDITLRLGLDGAGRTEIATGIGFFDHMLTAFGRHGLFDLSIAAKGDLHIDSHHTVEDVGIVLGRAFAPGAGRQARHHPLRPGQRADGRSPGGRRRRPLRPRLPRLGRSLRPADAGRGRHPAVRGILPRPHRQRPVHPCTSAPARRHQRPPRGAKRRLQGRRPGSCAWRSHAGPPRRPAKSPPPKAAL